MDVNILTPLWTGGVDGKVNRIQETGLLGSMRWWYQVLVRGLGGDVCASECLFNADAYKQSAAIDESERLKDAGLCDVCRVFGATGWKRRFRLSVTETNIKNAKIKNPIKVDEDRAYKDKNGDECRPAWYFSSKPKAGSFEILIQSLYPNFSSEIINGLIQSMADWTAVGARTQMGFGVVEPVARSDTRQLYQQLIASAGNCHYTTLPSLQNLFLARIQLINPREEDTFNLKYDLRRLFSEDKNLRHFIMGTTAKGEKQAAKIKISRPYGSGLMRVWGWIPEKSDIYVSSWDRNRIIETIHSHLTTNYNVEIWREMNSPRDTLVQNAADAETFLQSLLGIEEG